MQVSDIGRLMKELAPEPPHDVRQRVENLGAPPLSPRGHWRHAVLAACLALGVAACVVAIRGTANRPDRTSPIGAPMTSSSPSSPSARSIESSSVAAQPETGGTDPRCPGSCDFLAASSSQVAGYPPAQPAGPPGSWVSRDQAVAQARASAIGRDGRELTEDERSQVGVVVRAMTATAAADLLENGDPFDTLLPPDRPVWVVQVDRWDMQSFAQPTNIVHGYVVVLDRPSGWPIVRITGLAPFVEK